MIFKVGERVYPSEYSGVTGIVTEVWKEYSGVEMARVKAPKGLSGVYLACSLGRPVKRR
jgi:hypothetical protein